MRLLLYLAFPAVVAAGDLRLAASGTPERRAPDRDVAIWLSGRTLASAATAAAAAASKDQAVPDEPERTAVDAEAEAAEVEALELSILPYPDLASASEALRPQAPVGAPPASPTESGTEVARSKRWQAVIATGRDERERSILALLTIFASRMEEREGIPAGATIAMALHESNYGRSQLSAQHNNYFGLKLGRTAEPFVTMPTRELGKIVRANFRAYQDFEGGIAGFAAFLRRYPRYQVAWQTRDARSFVAALLKVGYCPEPDYMACIEIIFRRHKLDIL